MRSPADNFCIRLKETNHVAAASLLRRAPSSASLPPAADADAADADDNDDDDGDEGARLKCSRIPLRRWAMLTPPPPPPPPLKGSSSGMPGEG